ncbi:MULTISPECIES: putative quinol monooxygenase [Acidocella]|uniref:putative quinol monooxygenase n=1 Tax=Acidocella TaxID=50709 RepID=UPI00028ED07D|nr:MULTISPECIES: putative quinol monooxygenase [Acidocella]EKM99589.1 Antibiotic biosynthesis monooxygenase [Acidocella sp. MX-AZ02]WBO58222.1 antibiotic biosynthesis monooxygenase [Acidocella sp. MX-AZ03]
MVDNKIVYVFATLTAAPGRGTELRLTLEELVTATRQEPGNVTYTLHEATDAPGTFIVYEAYADQAAVDAHMASAHLKAALSAAGPLLGSPPVIIAAKQIA